MAKKANLNVSVNVDTSGYAKSWDEAVKITQGATKDVEKEAEKMAAKVSKKIEGMSIKSQARQLENLAAKMAEAGLAGTKAFTDVARSAGRLKADIDDTKGIINALRPDAPFNALNATLGAGAQAFAGVQGAMALFGGESENLQKTLLKVQAAMAFAEGFKAIDGLQDGFNQLNLIIKANPLIAGATIFAAITAGIFAWSDSLDTAAQKYEQLNAIQDKAFAATVQEKTSLERLLSVYNDKNTTDTERLRIQKELVSKYPEYLGQISTEAVEQGKVNAAVVGYIKLLDIKAKAQAAQELYVESLKEQQKLIKKVAHDQMRLMQTGNQISRYFSNELGITASAESLAKLNSEVDSLKQTYLNLSSAADKAADSQNKNFGTPPTSNSASTSRKSTYKSPFQKAPDTSGLSSFGVRENKAIDDYNKKLAETPKKIQAVAHEYKEYNIQTLRLIELNKTIANSIAQIAQDSLFSFGSAIGEMLGGSETAMQDFGDKLLSAIASFMEGISKAMIATAIASEVFQKTLFANPAVALAAGVALAIGAGFVKQQLKGGVQGTGFAEGGIIGGNSPSGDRLLAPVNSGEMIFNTGQQNQLLKLANGNAGGFGNMELKTSIRKNELIVWLDKGNSDLTR
jgi:hypothetical protein